MTRRARRSSIRVFFDDTDAPTTSDKRPRHVVGDLWFRDTTNQLYCLINEDDGTWYELRGPASAMIPHVLSTNFSMESATSAVISRYAEVGSGYTLTIPSGSDLEIT